MHNPHSDAKHSGPPALPASGILLLPRPRPAGDPRIGRPAGNQTAELAHDARNLFSALDLYCELLATPGVLAPGFRHYAEDLRLVAGSGARLIEALSCPAASSEAGHLHGEAVSAHNPPASNSSASLRRPLPAIEDLAAELMALETPLRALAGPEIRLEVECAPCAGLLALDSENLLRILFNLVANSVEAMMEPRPPSRVVEPSCESPPSAAGGTAFSSGTLSIRPTASAPWCCRCATMGRGLPPRTSRTSSSPGSPLATAAGLTIQGWSRLQIGRMPRPQRVPT